MLTKAPAFWWIENHPASIILAPLSWLYGAIAGRRMVKAAGARADVPVICVGNFTVGGTGKTPVSEALARAATAAGRKPGFVLRGYGAPVETATLVDRSRHTYRDVGDEALMLSQTAMVAVSPERADAAKLLEREGVDFIIMDDGLQSGKLKPDFAIAVVDGERGFGNSRCLPAGPLRAPLSKQFSKIDMLLINGSGGDEAKAKAHAAGVTVVTALSEPDAEASVLAGRDVFAYAGIGHPQKFFATLEQVGARPVKTMPLADHQPISADLARTLLDAAGALLPVTTAKDYARLSGNEDAAIAALREKSVVLGIKVAFGGEATAGQIVQATLDAFSQRRTEPQPEGLR